MRVLVLIAALVGASASPAAERAFLGGIDMAHIRSDKPFPFSPLPRRRAAGEPAASQLAHEAAKARFAAAQRSRSLRSALSGPSKAAVLAPRAPSLLQMPRLASMFGSDIMDDPMTDKMFDTINSMRRSLDFEQLRVYGCSATRAFGEPVDIEAPENGGFRRGTVVTYLRDLYDLSVLPTKCCNKRVRLGTGKYLPLTEFITIMIKQMREAEGGLMRVDLQHTFPPAFDFACLGLAGTPASVTRPEYRLKNGAQIAGTLARIDRALSTLLDLCTGKARGDDITEWSSAASSLRSEACEISSIV